MQCQVNYPVHLKDSHGCQDCNGAPLETGGLTIGEGGAESLGRHSFPLEQQDPEDEAAGYCDNTERQQDADEQKTVLIDHVLARAVILGTLEEIQGAGGDLGVVGHVVVYIHGIGGCPKGKGQQHTEPTHPRRHRNTVQYDG